MYKNILLATDGSELAAKALEQGFALAKTLGAQASVVTVTEPWTSVVSGEMGLAFPIDEYEKGCEANAASILRTAEESARAAGMTCRTVHVKDKFPAEGIIDTAKQHNSDLIVMASHGRRGLSRMLIGSQANQVVTHSAVPVLIVK